MTIGSIDRLFVGMSVAGFFVFHQKTLEQKAGSKPAGSVVEADYLGEIPTGSLVIPGAQITLHEP